MSEANAVQTKPCPGSCFAIRIVAPSMPRSATPIPVSDDRAASPSPIASGAKSRETIEPSWFVPVAR